MLCSLNGLGVGHLKLWPIFNLPVIVSRIANLDGLLGLGEVLMLEGPKLIVSTALSNGELVYIGLVIVTSNLHLRELLPKVDLGGLRPTKYALTHPGRGLNAPQIR